MDTELLVEDRIGEGSALLAQLVSDGFDVSVALWVRTREEGLWFFYIASTRVRRAPIADAYRAAYAVLASLRLSSLTISDIKLISPDNQIAADAIALRDRSSRRTPVRYTNRRFGQLETEEAYIYPSVMPGLTRDQVFQTITQLMNRTGLISPSAVTLRSGATLRATPVGIQVQQPGGIIVVLHNLTTGTNESFPIDEITNIQ